MKVERWGGALMIRLPADVIALLTLEEADEVNNRVSGPDRTVL